MPRDQVFISYSHQDEDYRHQLETQLRVLEQHYGVQVWSDKRRLKAGDRWRREIEEALERAKVAVLLISPEFLASDFIRENELPPLLKAAENEGVPIVWVPLRPSLVQHTPLADFQAAWPLDKPLSGLRKSQREAAWVEVCEQILRASQSMLPFEPSSRSQSGSEHDDIDATASPSAQVAIDESSGTLEPERASRLPACPQILVGREREITEVRELLKERRIVNLLGPPGAGKTTLAIAVSHASLVDFPEGVWWVELDSIGRRAGDLVPQAIATALGIREQAPRPPTEILADHLRSVKGLLVLDNCEHVVEAIREVLKELREHCPDLRILTTSRRGLRLKGEQIFRVRPLEAPDSRKRLSLEDVAAYNGVRLFVELARSEDYEFQLTSDNAASVAEIVDALDGIPLAISLAAAATRILSPKQIADQLEAVLPFLETENEVIRPHHETLDKTLEWSHDLLPGAAIRLFRRLSVFMGSFAWDDIDAVCFAGERPDPKALEKLVNHSLLVPSSGRRRKRFRLLEAVRQFGQKKLRSAREYDEFVQHHRDYFIQLAEAAAPYLLRSGQSEIFDRLETCHADMRAALDRALGARDSDLALRLATSLWRFWEIRGYLSEGRERLAQVLESCGNPRSERQAQALSGKSTLAYRQGDFESAEASTQEALEIYREHEDQAGAADAFNDLGNIALQRGSTEDALRYYEESYQIKRQLNDERELGVALFNLGSLALHRLRFEEAREKLEESQRQFEEIENLWESGFPLRQLGILALIENRYEDAEKLLHMSYERRRGAGDKRGMGDAVDGLARVAIARKDLEGCGEYIREALSLRREVRDQRGLVETLEVVVLYFQAQSRAADAVQIFAARDRLRKDLRIEVKPYFQPFLDNFVKSARNDLGAEAFERSLIEGAGLKREQIFAQMGDL